MSQIGFNGGLALPRTYVQVFAAGVLVKRVDLCHSIWTDTANYLEFRVEHIA
jgi:hypothetical protein